MSNLIAIIDFGSQYTPLIKRILSDIRVNIKIFSNSISYKALLRYHPAGIIFSGGPNSVYNVNALTVDKEFFHGNIPILGICYGMQLIVDMCGGKVEKAQKREYGPAMLFIDKEEKIFSGISSPQKVWMSHSDLVTKLPSDFVSIAHTDKTLYGAIMHKHKNIYGVQFHPEVFHTHCGKDIFKNFVYNVSGYKAQFEMKDFVPGKISEIKHKVKDSKVIGALSGGVDSTVSAILTHKAIGNNLILLFVDTGLLRIGDREKINYLQNRMELNINVINSRDKFLSALKGVSNPEEKRKIIGHKFIEVFEGFAKRYEDVKYLLQGTIYPDVIESAKTSTSNPRVIKSHHNVGGLPEKMGLKLLEPIRNLFKDEVRMIGKELGIDSSILMAHPFPGPGLSIRILGEVTNEKLDILRRVDKVYIDGLKKYGEYNNIWQAFSVLLPLRSVGVIGDERAYKFVVALRAVLSRDGMTADWAKIAFDVLEKISIEITNTVPEVGRVVYDITSKPPGTIEWE